MTTACLTAGEVEFHPTSFCDRNGRLFSWEGELYRALTHQGAAIFRKLSESGLLGELVECSLLVETEAAGFALEGWAMVVKHRRVPFVSFPIEWSPLMFRDAACLIGQLEERLRARGFGLNVNDLDLWNVLFRGPQPVYIDFGSIREAGGGSGRKYDDFFHSCVLPVRLAAAGQGGLARTLLRQENGQLLDDLSASEREARVPKTAGLPALFKRLFSAGSSSGQGLAIGPLTTEIEQLRFPEPAPLPASPTTNEDGSIANLITRLAPRSVLIAGRTSGVLSASRAALNCDVVLLDRYESVIDGCYLQARKEKAALLPLVMDIRRPTSGMGVCNREHAPASERLACEMVLALGVVEWLVFQRYLNFDQVSATLAQWAKRWLVVEFVGPEGDALRQRVQDDFYKWYGLDQFRASLSRHFGAMEVLSSSAGARSLLLCTR